MIEARSSSPRWRGTWTRAALALSVLASPLGACADMDPDGSSSDGEATAQVEEELVERRTVKIHETFERPFGRDFTKTFSGAVERKGYSGKATLTAQASLDITRIDIRGTVTYTKSRLGRYRIVGAELTTKGFYSAEADLQLKLQGSGDDSVLRGLTERELDATPFGGKALELARDLFPTNIPVSGPLFVHTHFDLAVSCGVDVGAEVDVKTGVGVKGELDVKARYDRDGRLPGGKKLAFSAAAPNFRVAPKPWVTFSRQANIHGRCALQPIVTVLFESLVGAKISVDPYIDVVAQELGVPPKLSVRAEAGIVGHAESAVEVFGHPVLAPREFEIFEKELHSFSR